MFNDVTQPFFWFHIVQTAGADQRVQHRRMFTTTIGTREGDADDFLDCFIMPAHIVGGTFLG